MRSTSSLLSALLLTGVVGLSALPVWAQEGVLFKQRAGETNYCHMKFPAIREDTLSWDRPVLGDKSTGDIIDYYGSCNHDPLGKEEIWAQRLQEQRQRQKESE